jgi:hypothetical protein
MLYRNFPPYYLDYFSGYYTHLEDLLDSLKKQLEIFEVDSVISKIEVAER